MRVIIIGTGFGRYAMAPVYEKLGFETEVITPREPDRIDAALAAGADLVSIHSPPFMHHEHVIKALDKGLPVLCDKPFGRNGAQAREMRDRAKAVGALNFLNCEFRAKPSRAKMIDLIHQGAIGELEHVTATFFSNGLRGRNHGWLNDAEMGGGWLGAWGSHGIDTLRWLFGSEVANCGGVTRIETRLRPDGAGGQRASTAEDAFSAWFVMENGCTAAIDSAFSASTPLPSRLLVMGSTGSLELVGENKLILRREPEDDPSIPREERIRRAVMAGEGELVFQAPPLTGEAHEPALTPWLGLVKQALQTGAQIAPAFDDGVAVAEAMELFRSKALPAGRKAAG